MDWVCCAHGKTTKSAGRPPILSIQSIISFGDVYMLHRWIAPYFAHIHIVEEGVDRMSGQSLYTNYIQNQAGLLSTHSIFTGFMAISQLVAVHTAWESCRRYRFRQPDGVGSQKKTNVFFSQPNQKNCMFNILYMYSEREVGACFGLFNLTGYISFTALKHTLLFWFNRPGKQLKFCSYHLPCPVTNLIVGFKAGGNYFFHFLSWTIFRVFFKTGESLAKRLQSVTCFWLATKMTLPSVIP